jgi:hypothetical protein
MTTHLTDEQLSAVLLTEDDAAARRHLDSCPECARDLAAVQADISEYARDARQRSGRPEEFWRDQRVALDGRRRHDRTRRLAAWTSVAAAACAALWLGVRPPAPRPTSTAVDADDALLVAVQRSLRRDVPSALEPVELLVADIGADAESAARP